MMYGWWDYGVSPPWYGFIFGPIMMMGFVVLAVLIIAWVVRASGLGWRSCMPGKSSLDILNDRLARGEIDRAEYQERKQLLSGS
jgi:putative membrane protein